MGCRREQTCRDALCSSGRCFGHVGQSGQWTLGVCVLGHWMGCRREKTCKGLMAICHKAGPHPSHPQTPVHARPCRTPLWLPRHSCTIHTCPDIQGRHETCHVHRHHTDSQHIMGQAGCRWDGPGHPRTIRPPARHHMCWDLGHVGITPGQTPLSQSDDHQVYLPGHLARDCNNTYLHAVVPWCSTIYGSVEIHLFSKVKIWDLDQTPHITDKLSVKSFVATSLVYSKSYPCFVSCHTTPFEVAMRCAPPTGLQISFQNVDADAKWEIV